MKTVEYSDGAVWLLDQTQLPLTTTFLECRSHRQVASAIVNLSVRGAPAIGVSAAYGVVLAARSLAAAGLSGVDLEEQLDLAMEDLRSTRPTAVNLFWALQRMRATADSADARDPGSLIAALEAEAARIQSEDDEAGRTMARLGADLIPDGAGVLTHCNTGALAAGAFGTALGVIREAHDRGKRIHVWVDETRPLLQGARLTAWELQQAGVPFTLIVDSMAGHFMARGEVDLVMVGADRIVANGDGANKIGTYSVAVLAHAHDIPFYFVAPASTVDIATPSGDSIVIEERKPEEVASFGGVRTAPAGVRIANPAFDVTPARLVAAIVTDRGIVRPPFAAGLARIARTPHPPVEPVESALATDEGT